MLLLTECDVIVVVRETRSLGLRSPPQHFMPSLANEVSECVTESELGVGDRIFGQIPFDGGSGRAVRTSRELGRMLCVWFVRV